MKPRSTYFLIQRISLRIQKGNVLYTLGALPITKNLDFFLVSHKPNQLFRNLYLPSDMLTTKHSEENNSITNGLKNMDVTIFKERCVIR